VEMLGNRKSPAQADIGGKLRVRSQHPCPWGTHGPRIEMRDLTTGVHSGIGAARTYKAYRLIGDAR